MPTRHQKGNQFAFNSQENREILMLSRYSTLAQQERALGVDYREQQVGAISQFGGNTAKMAGGFGMGAE